MSNVIKNCSLQRSLTRQWRQTCQLLSIDMPVDFVNYTCLLACLLTYFRAEKNFRPGQVDFLAESLTFKAYMPNRQGSSHPLTKSLTKTNKRWPRPRKCERCLPKGQAGIRVFLKPCYLALSKMGSARYSASSKT